VENRLYTGKVHFLGQLSLLVDHQN